MTVAIGFLCSDGVVIGVDSMLTPTLGTLNVGHHHARKIDVLPGHQIYAFAGDLGQAHRFKTLAEVNHARPSQLGHPLDYPIALSQGLMAQFISTGIATNAVGVNTLLAFLHGAVVSAAPSKARCNRGFSIRTTTIPLSAQGTFRPTRSCVSSLIHSVRDRRLSARRSF